MLVEKSPMLMEYFGIRFEWSVEGARLVQLPILLDNYTPLQGGLPDFLLDLAWKVRDSGVVPRRQLTMPVPCVAAAPGELARGEGVL